MTPQLRTIVFFFLHDHIIIKFRALFFALSSLSSSFFFVLRFCTANGKYIRISTTFGPSNVRPLFRRRTYTPNDSLTTKKKYFKFKSFTLIAIARAFLLLFSIRSFISSPFSLYHSVYFSMAFIYWADVFAAILFTPQFSVDRINNFILAFRLSSRECAHFADHSMWVSWSRINNFWFSNGRLCTQSRGALFVFFNGIFYS